MRSKAIIVVFCLIAGVALVIGAYFYLEPIAVRLKFDNLDLFSQTARIVFSKKNSRTQAPVTSVATTPGSIFTENFDKDYTLVETGSVAKSKNSNWWVNSGAYLFSANGIGRTIMGSLPSTDPWRIAYLISTPSDTDSGYHPQNIFRLVQRGNWQNFSQQSYYKIDNYYLSPAEQRAASNGLLLFNRYVDEDNLYYTGIRVDGTAIIKKKYKGIYYTMAQQKIFNGTYDRNSNPNLLPDQQWMGIKSEVSTEGDTVKIAVYADLNNTGAWKLVAQAEDKKGRYGGDPIYSGGYAGIRTDFMDVEFDNYKIEENK